MQQGTRQTGSLCDESGRVARVRCPGGTVDTGRTLGYRPRRHKGPSGKGGIVTARDTDDAMIDPMTPFGTPDDMSY